MRVLVCGGRNFSDSELLNRELNKLSRRFRISALIHGAYRGADTLAGEWGNSKGIRVIPVPAEWTVHGPAAGPIRNSKMLAMDPDVVVAFPGGDGTADMVSQARWAGIQVIEIRG